MDPQTKIKELDACIQHVFALYADALDMQKHIESLMQDGTVNIRVITQIFYLFLQDMLALRQCANSEMVYMEGNRLLVERFKQQHTNDSKRVRLLESEEQEEDSAHLCARLEGLKTQMEHISRFFTRTFAGADGVELIVTHCNRICANALCMIFTLNRYYGLLPSHDGCSRSQRRRM